MMDKKQATDHVVNRLKNGHDIESIAADLSEELGVPLNLITKFVNIVSDSQSPIQSQGEKASITEGKTRKRTRDAIMEPLESNENASMYVPPSLNKMPVIEDIPSNPPQPLEAKSDESALPIQGTKVNDDYNLEEIRLFVIKSIKNHHRHNDIVAAVCTRTGMSWNAAQRFVASTQTKNHEELTKSYNTGMLLFSVLFIVGGVLLLSWSVISMLNYYNTFTGLETETLPQEFLVWIVTGFITSLGIISGGIFGFYRSISNQ